MLRSSPTTLPDEPLNAAAPRIRLEFLDGLRGASALAVVLFHLLSPGNAGEELPWLLRWTRYGAWAVPVFIVLSGYCLTLPAARDAQRRVPGGWPAFFRRRARRILPPYYAALLLACALVGLSQWSRHGQNGALDSLSLNPANIAAHVFLVHNLSEKLYLGLDPPLWSVATEWQIYFLFPLLIAAWRRWSLGWSVTAAFVLGLSPHWVLPAGHNFDWARPWYLGLFALGMAAAAVGHSPRHADRLAVAKLPWLAASVAGAALFAALLAMHAAPGAGQIYPMSWPADVIVGIAAACLILHCAHGDGRWGFTSLRRILESRPGRALGRFSYSLYLVHMPLMWPLLKVLRVLGLPQPMQLLALLGVVLPATMGLSYLFYLVAERPFVAKTAAVVQTAAVARSPEPSGAVT